MSRLVSSVNTVQLRLEKSNPPRLVISAMGMASTPGWKKPVLETRIKGLNPEGFMEFDFKADPPSGMVSQVLTPIGAEAVVENPMAGLKGVIVHAANNAEKAVL